MAAFADDVRRRGGTATVLGRHHQHAEAAIKRAERLVLPLRGVPPPPMTPEGAFLTSQAALWRRFHKPADQLHALDLGLVTDSEPAAAAGPPAQLDGAALRRWSPAALLDLLFPPADAPRAGRAPRRAPRARVWIESNATEPKHGKLLKRELDLRWGVPAGRSAGWPPMSFPSSQAD